ncbi:MAG: hypothetical protein ACFFD4_37925 [Candidatus Odinarchaeota archaeon]
MSRDIRPGGGVSDTLYFGDGQRFELAQSGMRPTDRESLKTVQKRATLSPFIGYNAQTVSGGLGVVFLILTILSFNTYTQLHVSSYSTLYLGFGLVTVISFLVALFFWKKK